LKWRVPDPSRFFDGSEGLVYSCVMIPIHPLNRTNSPTSHRLHRREHPSCRGSTRFAVQTTPYYVYDIGGRQVSDWGSAWAAGYIYLSGQLVAEYGNGTTYFVHHDHLGSARLMTSLSGSVVDCGDFLPFGEQQSYTGTTPCVNNNDTTHKFTGKERDSESNLDYFGARHYSSQYGRFMTPDPIGIFVADVSNPQSWNQYSYVLNNPLNFTDPTGTECVWDDGSYDSADDPNTGSREACENKKNGGTWFNPAYFNAPNGDWSDQGDPGLAQTVKDSRLAASGGCPSGAICSTAY
jgi:RHS repeat-associated protein